MEYLNYIIFAFALFLVIMKFLPTKGVQQISTSELKNQLKDKRKQFIDVRTPAEFKSSNIRGFENIPLQHLPQKADLLKKDSEVVVICRSGMRSSKACKVLKKQGYKHITNVKGGMNAWT
ncbi:rhodanese-like domain-containing protein [Salipaludibacillus sp. HK11]|uniref:rhodanese-like domain-containing protein n=1 Tax=Salipaludibacillus sp. HK11 TaxID=3394320 RepID=UPI0039FC617A